MSVARDDTTVKRAAHRFRGISFDGKFLLLEILHSRHRQYAKLDLDIHTYPKRELHRAPPIC